MFRDSLGEEELRVLRRGEAADVQLLRCLDLPALICTFRPINGSDEEMKFTVNVGPSGSGCHGDIP